MPKNLRRFTNRYWMISPIIGFASFSCGDDNTIHQSSRSRLSELPQIQQQDQQADTTQQSELTSLEAFSQTVHPLLVKYCAGCHQTVAAPYIAAADAQEAQDAIIETGKVDFAEPSASRLVMRLAHDQHNCWSPDCAGDGRELLAAISKWIDLAKITAEREVITGMSAELGLADAETRMVNGGPGTFQIEGESATLSAPMVIANDANAAGGKYVAVTSVVNATLADTDATAGKATYAVNITAPGKYFIWGKVSAPNTNDRSFHVNVDGGPYAAWIIPVAAGYQWDQVSNTNATVDMSYDLTAGAHKIEVRQRQDGTRLDQLVVTDIATFNATTDLAPKPINVLKFDVSAAAGAAGTYVELEISKLDEFSYKVKSPKLISTTNMHVHGMHLYINGRESPSTVTFESVDVDIPAPGGLISPAASVLLIDKSEIEDKFSISFDHIGS